MFTKLRVEEVMRDIIRCQILYKNEKNLYTKIFIIFSHINIKICVTRTHMVRRDVVIQKLGVNNYYFNN